jgi:hypothetical protein
VKARLGQRQTNETNCQSPQKHGPIIGVRSRVSRKNSRGACSEPGMVLSSES